MPLVAYSELPAFETLRLEGVEVTTPELAAQSNLSDLRIGLLNLMPDAALRATDRQFIRLVSASGIASMIAWAARVGVIESRSPSSSSAGQASSVALSRPVTYSLQSFRSA